MPSETLNKNEREICWNARDVYLGCLNSYKDLAVADEKCSDHLKSFHEACPRYWVKHFIRSYRIEKFKQAEADAREAMTKNPEEAAKLLEAVTGKTK